MATAQAQETRIATQSPQRAAASLLEKRVSLELQRVPMATALMRLHQASGVPISFSPTMLPRDRQVSCPCHDVTLETALAHVLGGSGFDFIELTDQIVIVTRGREQPAPRLARSTRAWLEPQRTAFARSRQVPITAMKAGRVRVTGRVVDAMTLEPLGGVTISVVGTPLTTLSASDGSYSFLDVPPGTRTLRASLIGFDVQESTIEINADDGPVVVDFQLTVRAIALEGIVAVAYGTQRRDQLTGAMTAVTGEELATRPARNVQSALQGRAPGLTVWDQGGEPGAANMFFRIRGTTTLSSSQPLVIVDGIEQNWADINPNEIESISVLKDAASTAIYGSRGANGIILITTRRGQTGRFTVSYNSSLDLQNLAVVPEHMDTESYMRLQNVAYQNRGSEPLFSEEDIQRVLGGDDRLSDPLPNTWFETVIHDNAPMQSHSLTLSGGTGQLSSLAALSFFDQQGIYPNRDHTRYHLRLNNDLILNDRLSVGADLNVRRNTRTTTNNAGDIYIRMIHGSQWAVPRYPDGTYGLSPQGHNPLAYTDPDVFGAIDTKTDYTVLNLNAEWGVLSNLRLRSQYGIELSKSSTLETEPAYQIRDYWNPDVVLRQNNVPSLSESRSEFLQTTWNTTLTYDATFLDHGLTLLGGYSEIAYRGNTLWASGRNLYNNDIRALGQSDPENRDLSSGYSDWGLRSFFARLNYSFEDRYLIEVSTRYDGSSRFPAGDRYTLFPSIALGWRISEESFWEPLRSTVTEFKPRLSWGKAGNQNVGLYTYFDQLDVANYYVFNNTPVTGVRQNALTSRDLTWETTTQLNLGLDATLFGDLLDVQFDWFDKVTDGILLNLPVPGVLGLSPAPTNAGSVKNTGWELALRNRGRIGAVNYDFAVNVSDIHNEVVDLAGTGPYFSLLKNWRVVREGSPIHSLWGYRTDGYLTQEDLDNGHPTFSADARPGDIKYLDLNGDGVIGPDDKTVLGSTQPRWTYGAALNMDWRQWDFSVGVQGVAEQDMAIWGAFVENGSWEGFALAIGKDYWTPENPDALFPRPQKQTTKNTEPADKWVENAAYLRVKNVQLGYTLPAGLAGRIGLDRLRVYIGGTNLFTLSGLDKWGTDAETVSGRADYYPPVKSYTVGFNVGF